MSLFERIFAWYLLTVLAIAGAFGFTAPGDQPARTASYVALHVGLLAGLLVLPRVTRGRTAWGRLLAQGLYTVVALPVVFQSLGLLLPGIHPEPFELLWIDVDRALFGFDPTVALQGALSPLAVELLQLCYATFYLLPIVLIATLLVQHRTAAGYATLVTVAFGFLLSYLGYLVWPTLPPYRFLWHGDPQPGLWLADGVHRLLDSAEWNRWDCFPSGHTMLTLVTLALAWRHARRLFWGMLPVGLGLVFSTMALRYHYVIDVLAGAAAAPLAVWLADSMLRWECAGAQLRTLTRSREPSTQTS